MKAPNKLTEDSIVILMDPDMILLRPITHDFSDAENHIWAEGTKTPLTRLVQHGHPMAQQVSGYVGNRHCVAAVSHRGLLLYFVWWTAQPHRMDISITSGCDWMQNSSPIEQKNSTSLCRRTWMVHCIGIQGPHISPQFVRSAGPGSGR